MKSSQNFNFSRIEAPNVQRSVFDRSSSLKTTFDSAFLVPMFIDEILPGDTVRMQATFFARLQTLRYPIMDNVFLDTFWFFVPSRLLWNHWEEFNGALTDVEDTPTFTDYEIPRLAAGETWIDVGLVGDYFGLPIPDLDHEDGIQSIQSINALPFRAYRLIYNEWFRDENLQDKESWTNDDGPDSLADCGRHLLKRGKRKDYFTSCLPWPQKGEAVTIPLGGTAPVIGDGYAMGLYPGNGNGDLYLNFMNDTGQNGILSVKNAGGAVGGTPTGSFPTGDSLLGLHHTAAKSHVIADLSEAGNITVNLLRESLAIQEMLERDARGGTRYVEMLKSQFGVTSPDFRLQRPEYLGGQSTRIDVRQVAQTSGSPASVSIDYGGTPQGNLSAYTSVESGSGFNKSFTEHGFLIGLVNVRSDITYQNQIRKLWSRSTREDHYIPALAHLGEQAVLNKEIFYTGVEETDNAVFGYQERWAEYRYFPNMVTGLFRSANSVSLDVWHLASDFGTVPALNDEFIEDAPPLDRVITVTDQPQVIMDALFSMKHARPMPTFSTPGLMARF